MSLNLELVHHLLIRYSNRVVPSFSAFLTHGSIFETVARSTSWLSPFCLKSVFYTLKSTIFLRNRRVKGGETFGLRIKCLFFFECYLFLYETSLSKTSIVANVFMWNGSPPSKICVDSLSSEDDRSQTSNCIECKSGKP